uniref:Translation initiation factor IF-3 n=1 Tax=Cyanidium sp. THAL103 TaxID=3027999 RepID=A0A9Y1I485_9RHOD|nr:translation initiation factor 3 [Cyanidium sp. THAL103]
MRSKIDNSDLPIINERINFPEVRVIDNEGNQLGIMKISEAMTVANDRDLDLVLISDKSSPPVCKIVDYGKHKFYLEKKAKEIRKKQTSVIIKELKIRYNIEEHDYQVRVNQLSKFLKSGDKVKITLSFRGREIQHVNLGDNLLNKLIVDLKSISEIEQKPHREGKNITAVLIPKNFI